MVVGLFVAGLGIGANVRRTEPVTRSQASGIHLAPFAGYLTWGGLALVFGCLIAITMERSRQARGKAATGVA